ncbi:MAG: methyltransferase domain-containing protein [Planctomycetota bacterium]
MIPSQSTISDRLLTDGDPLWGETITRLSWVEQRWSGAGAAVWRGGPAGRCVRPDGSVDRFQTERFRGELAYWLRELKSPGAGGFAERFDGWQAERRDALRLALTEAEGGPVPDLDAWTARCDVIELGGGPRPFVALGTWRSAVMIDPLVEGYRSSGILDDRGSFVPIASGAERLPLPARCCDLVVCDNMLDHVNDPAEVCCEVSRVLRPGGLLWLLVDVGAPVDEMHPHQIHEELLHAMLSPIGMERVFVRETGRPSHPMAHGQLRAMYKRQAERRESSTESNDPPSRYEAGGRQ